MFIAFNKFFFLVKNNFIIKNSIANIKLYEIIL